MPSLVRGAGVHAAPNTPSVCAHRPLSQNWLRHSRSELQATAWERALAVGALPYTHPMKYGAIAITVNNALWYSREFNGNRLLPFRARHKSTSYATRDPNCKMDR
jgi:hypothetical protein